MLLPRDMLYRCSTNVPERIAYYCNGGSWSWSDMERRACALAHAFGEQLGVGKGDVVAILGKESIEIYDHFFACMKIGAIRVGLNWRYSVAELMHVLSDSGAKVLLLQAQCVPIVKDILADIRELGITIVGYDGDHQVEIVYEQLLERPLALLDPPAMDAKAPLLITYTSGSTGKPKGVVHTNGSVANIILQSLIGRGLSPDDIWMQASASSWMTVILNILGLGNGMAHVIMDGAFDTLSFMRDVQRYKATAIMLVPTIIKRVLEEYKKGGFDLSSVRLLMYGSSPISPKLACEAYETLRCELIQSYGMTEGGWVTQLSASDHRRAITDNHKLLQSVGRPGVMSRLSIRDHYGAPLPAGEIGEVWLQNEMLMEGYLNLPEKTREVFRDGWLRTNDYGAVDENGYLYLHGRKDFMIISGAVNIFPSSVEGALLEHPAVEEVAVVGTAHPDLGEAVVAVVVPSAGTSSMAAAELVDFCLPVVGKLSTPKHFFFVDELPKTSTGKVQRHVLKDWVSSQASAFPWRTSSGTDG